MKLRMIFCALIGLLLLATPSTRAAAQNSNNNVIVRDSLGLSNLQVICSAPLLGLGCTVLETLDGTIVPNNLFLVSPPAGVSAATLIHKLLNLNVLGLHLLGIVDGIVDAEPDLLLHVMQSQTAPAGLYDTNPVNYYGTSVWDGYANQPAVQKINLQSAHSNTAFTATGAGIVAVIDTGVDTTHPVLQGVLQQGHDFTRNQNGGSELGDVTQWSMAVVDGASPPRSISGPWRWWIARTLRRFRSRNTPRLGTGRWFQESFIWLPPQPRSCRSRLFMPMGQETFRTYCVRSTTQRLAARTS